MTNVDAAKLDNIDSTSFLRSDVPDTKTFGDLTFSDNTRLNLGSGGQQDSSIYHSGTNTYLDNRNGDLILQTIDTGEGGNGDDIIIKAGTGKTSIFAHNNGAVELWNNGSKKFETTGYGIAIFGGANVSGVATFADNVIFDSTNACLLYTSDAADE